MHVVVLEVAGLEVEVGGVPILRGVRFALETGRTLGVVGESGCGKSMTALAAMGMLPPSGRVTAGSIRLNGRDLTGLSEREWRKVRGAEIALVMQDPFSSLNPTMRVGWQVAEALQLHRSMGRRRAWVEAVRLLAEVGVPDAAASARRYPHQMSGGQRQRVVIATAFACRPKVLIADEPTTALDATLQAQILRLIQDLRTEEGTAVMLISHDIGVIAACAEQVAVFYAGQVVETGPTAQVLATPRHPYTRALMAAMPRPGVRRLDSISGQPPKFDALPAGCAFAPRCPLRFERCDQEPELAAVEPARAAACWRAESQHAPSSHATP